MYLAEDHVRMQGECDRPRFLMHRLDRPYVGNWCRSGVDHGFSTMSSPHTPWLTCRIRCVMICLGMTFQSDSSQVPELVSQCRRLLNGSSFAVTRSVVKFYYIYRSSHTFVRKFLIHVELLYQAFNLILSWFSLVRFPYNS